MKRGHDREVLQCLEELGREVNLCRFENIVMQYSSEVLFFRIFALRDVILKLSSFVMLFI